MAEKKKKRKDGRYSKQVTIGLRNGKPIRKFINGKNQMDDGIKSFRNCNPYQKHHCQVISPRTSSGIPTQAIFTKLE